MRFPKNCAVVMTTTSLTLSENLGKKSGSAPRGTCAC
jgi:hypothetical protein